MIKTIKIMLLPNKKQETKLFECAGTARFIYNWAIDLEDRNHKEGGGFLTDKELRRVLTILKKDSEYSWLNMYSNNIPKQAVKDACKAYKNFFDGRAAFPKFKSRKKSRPSFYVDPYKIQFTGTHVRLEKLTASRKKNRQKFNWIKLAERDRVPDGCIYSNPRVTYDGIHWFISVGIEYPESVKKPKADGIGIDIGIKELAICSDTNIYNNINRTKEIQKLKKKKRRIQRQVSRKYDANRIGKKYIKTRNIKKAEKQLRKLEHRLSGIRNNYLHQTTTEIIKRKPSFIVLEDLNVKGMMKNRHLAESIAGQSFYEFQRQITYKAGWNSIKIIKADRFYPSSKRCSRCGSIKAGLELKDRVYKCGVCGLVIDRDFNAAMNLYQYGKDKTA